MDRINLRNLEALLMIRVVRPNDTVLDPRAFETGTKCRFQNAPHGLNARRSKA